MKRYESKEIRNVVVIGHGGCGKTSLCEALIFNAGVTTRLGKVLEETSTFDFEPEEIKRKISISAAVGYFEWKRHKINIIDTPGDGNFLDDAKNCIRVMDAAILVISGSDGIQVQTSRLWELTQEFNLPVLIWINKMDLERADFKGVMEEIKQEFTKSVVPLQIPIGRGTDFREVINLVSFKAELYSSDGSGKFETKEVSGSLKEEAESYQEALIEGVASTDDSLIEIYLDKGTLGKEELLSGLRAGFLSRSLVPVLGGSATLNIGTHLLSELFVSIFPSPEERGVREGINPISGEKTVRPAKSEASFSAQVFKTIVDQYTGKLSIFRIFSGTLSSDSTFLNSSRKIKERFGHIIALCGKRQELMTSACCGEVVAVAKLKETTTGDTICDERDPVVFEEFGASNPVITFAIKPKTRQDEDRVAEALSRLQEEDSSLSVSRDTEAKEILVSGMGEVHIEVMVEKLRRKFGVEVDLLPPKVPYRETIKGCVEMVEGKHKKQTGGHGQYGLCYLKLEPLERGKGFDFVNKIVGGAIPRQYIPSVEKGIVNAMAKGVIAGYPVVDIRVTLQDGKFHEVDSSDISFQLAASKGFKAGFLKANPTLLEPIMNLEVIVPDEVMGDVIGDINQRRGRILGMDAKGKNQIIKAQVPMAEILRYAPTLRSITAGRGTFTMSFSHYEELPPHLQEKVISEAKSQESKD